MMNEEIKKIVQKAAKKVAGFDVSEISIEKPKIASHGDYSTNIALALAKKMDANPLEVAMKIAARIKKPAFLEKIETVAPGFINFYLSDAFFVGNVKEVLKGLKPAISLRAKKVMVEYTDPNILKEFHIGHLMSNAIGESISRMLEYTGVKVKRANYQSDVGLGIAKAIWGKLKNPKQSWQEAYVAGSTLYEEDGIAKREIVALNKIIFERSDTKINALYDEGRAWSLEYFSRIYKKLDTTFDYYFFESEVAGFGKKVVEDGLKKGIFEKGEGGAIIFKGEKFGLHTRVFINSEGLPTYEAKELGLANVKFKKYKYDASMVVTANEVNEYFKVLLVAMGQLFPDLAKKTKHIGHGMLRLPEGKMSSRTGKVVTAESLIHKAKELILEKIKERDFSSQEKETVAEQVTIASIKYSILKQSIGSDIIYDFDKSISFEGDSGPYLQYSYARAVSVLKKAKREKVKVSLKKVPAEITQLEKMMAYFTDVVQKSAKEYQPHFVALYLTELAREFNNYYANNKIADKADEFSPYKVALTQAFSIIMKQGLWLLGIQAPEKM